MHTSYTILLLLASGLSEAQQRPCIPIPSNLTTPDSADDVPAIEAVIKDCGDGGTILFPSSRLYQIGSPLDLSSCHGCTFQIDGTLNISALDTWTKWRDQSSMFELVGASNVTISGNGLINGNNWDSSRFFGPTTMFNITSASNIRISGLTIRSPKANMFVIRDSRDIQVSSLSLSTNLDPNSPVTYSSWVNGFDIAVSSNIDISSQMSITGVSECVVVHGGVNSTSISGLNCAGTQGGVIIDVQRYDSFIERPISNLSFTNLTIVDAYWATGILSRGGTLMADNVTWQDVRVRGVMRALYVVGCQGSGCYGPQNPGTLFKTRNITFVNYEGQSKANGYNFECPEIQGRQCDFQARNINVTTTGCPTC
jgi:galacturan 1,4-alpha-galacturonidase